LMILLSEALSSPSLTAARFTECAPEKVRAITTATAKSQKRLWVFISLCISYGFGTTPPEVSQRILAKRNLENNLILQPARF
jgi:hypothetical protein